MSRLDLDEYTEKYAEVCNVIERNYHSWPLDHDSENDPGFGLLHTSDEARAAATRIFKILGIGLTDAGEVLLRAEQAVVEPGLRAYLARRNGGAS
jgi:hypothetical protein